MTDLNQRAALRAELMNLLARIYAIRCAQRHATTQTTTTPQEKK